MTEFMKGVASFLSNNFEAILFINFLVILAYILAMISFRIKYSDQRVIEEFVNMILYQIVCVGQIAMVFLYGYVYWINYQTPVDPFLFPQDVQLNTRWIKTPLTLYFIINNKFCSIDLDGRNRKDLFTADSPIREYHIAPDGKNILIVTKTQLYLLNQKTQKTALLDHVDIPPDSDATDILGIKVVEQDQTAESLIPSPGQKADNTRFKAVLSGVRWSPDGVQFCYEKSRWSKVSGQTGLYLYNIKEMKNYPIRVGSRRIASLRWDDKGENLYYLNHEVKNPVQYAYPYELKVYQVPLKTLRPQLLTRIPSESTEIPLENLDLRDIDLFLEGDNLIFKRLDERNHLSSKNGTLLGIDEKDYLFLKTGQWFKKRLFRIPRRPDPDALYKHQFKGGRLMLTKIRWLPGNNYVIMQHQYLGTLILNPWFLTLGQLTAEGGDVFGWYYPITLSSQD